MKRYIITNDTNRTLTESDSLLVIREAFKRHQKAEKNVRIIDQYAGQVIEKYSPVII